MRLVEDNQCEGQREDEMVEPRRVQRHSMKKMLLWRFMLVLLVGLGLVWIFATRMPPAVAYLNDTAVAPLIGRLAPDFTLAATDGRTFQLSSLRGKPVVVNFWATWCPPCRKEMPELEQLWQRYGTGSELMLLGVNQAEDVATIQQFRSMVTDVSFPILLDYNTGIARLYSVQALPTTFFIDAEGRIQDVKIGGPMDSAVLMDGVNKILAR